MLLCGIDCVIARDLLAGDQWESSQFGVLTDELYISPCTVESQAGECIKWPADISSELWNQLLYAMVDKLGIGTAVIAFEDELPAGLLLRWQEAAPMALFRRADELKSVLGL